MHYKMEGIIVRALNVRERDRFLIILTRKHGLIRAFARNIYGAGSHLCGHVNMFCYGSFLLYSSPKNNTFTVDEAFCQESFFELEKDIVGFTLATYFCDLVQAFEPQNEDSEAFLRLLLNALFLLTKGKRTAHFLKPVVELRMATIAGYMPDIAGCVRCGTREGPLFFSPANSSIYCKKCVPKNLQLFNINDTVLTAMQYICYSKFEKLFNFQIHDEKALETLGRLTEAYILHVSERNFRPLNVYHQLDSFH